MTGHLAISRISARSPISKQHKFARQAFRSLGADGSSYMRTKSSLSLSSERGLSLFSNSYKLACQTSLQSSNTPEWSYFDIQVLAAPAVYGQSQSLSDKFYDVMHILLDSRITIERQSLQQPGGEIQSEI